MQVSQERLEGLYNKFLLFIKSESGEEFRTFKHSEYLDSQEHYKNTVYEEARGVLGFQFWKVEEIGTGKIQQRVISAIKARVNHKGGIVDNNLIDWRKKDSFSKIPRSREIETALFNLYKNKAVGGDKADDGRVFQQLLDVGLSYQLIAYLFFLKEKNKYLPISQARFDSIFELIGLPEFKTSGNGSWENYSQFCGIIKGVWRFLRGKDKDVELVDAHSFLWIIGNHMKGFLQPSFASSKTHDQVFPTVAADASLTEPIQRQNRGLSFLQWVEILQNGEITREIDLTMFQILLSFSGHKAYGSEISAKMGITHHPLNSEVGRYAKRISEYYNIDFTKRNEQEYKFWDLFFNGWTEGGKFVWQLRPEIAEALAEVGLAGTENETEVNYADELYEEDSKPLYEGLKRTVTVNAYERNPKARKACIDHWGVACIVCGFDFGKVFGKIGQGYIHVHHLVPVSSFGKVYEVDPINDLVPVCPNCHSMLHTDEPPMAIEKLKAILEKNVL